jgi:hypothetical protein
MIELIPVHGLPEIRKDDDLARSSSSGSSSSPATFVPSKARLEGRGPGVVRIDDCRASAKAVELAGDERDARGRGDPP